MLQTVLTHRFAPILALVLAMTSLQAGAALAKSLFPAVGASGAVTLRLAISAVILFAVFRPWRVFRLKRPWRALVLYGAALGGMNFCFYKALETDTPLGIVVALEFAGPMAVALASSRQWRDLIWIGFAIAGLALLLPFGQSGGVTPAGAAYALAAGGFWALYIVFGQRAGQQHGVQAVPLGGLVAALLVAPVGVADNGAALFTPALLPLALAVALMSTVVPYTLEMFALTRMDRTPFGVFMSCEPAIAAVIGAMVLLDRLTALQWFAIGLIILASAGVAKASAVTPPRTIKAPAQDPGGPHPG